MIVVSDAGPLIALAKVDRLVLLRELFGEVLIPQTVQRELFAKHGAESARLDEALLDFLRVVTVSAVAGEVEAATSRLGLGEKHAIALAHERRALLVIDDRMGRAVARRLGLSITGIVGVLIQAKQVGLVPDVGTLLRDMCRRGYWLSDEVLAAAAELAGEG
jgi:predicted nucleic acid-binding protein